ncbi:MAG: TldD/PmbA family protein [Theionarchaea archaeon]|nr:TldD/PmbA family protein [Theionarchaea archaeon]MBU7038810.1 TldD/PmbA family protein [Theionarchaea archaeon]
MNSGITESVKHALECIQNAGHEGDVFGVRKSTTRYTIMKGNIADSSDYEDMGLGIRVLNNRRSGFGYCIPGDEEKGVRGALQSSRFSPEVEMSLPTEKKSHEVKKFDKKMEEGFGDGRGVEFVQTIIDGVLSLKKDITPASGEVTAVTGARIVENTQGVFLEEASTFIYCQVEAVIPRETGSLKAMGIESSRRFDIDFHQLGVETAEKVDSMREHSPRMTSDLPVVMSPDAFAQLLGYAFLPAFYGENVRSGRSPYRGRLGEEIILDPLTIIDNPCQDWGLGSGGFDDEGVQSSEVPILQEGVITRFLYDLKEGARSGAGSTANGVRRTFKTAPGTAHRNVSVRGGHHCTDIAHGDGIYVDTILGVGASNPMNGHFSVAAEPAWLLEKGEKKGRIDGIMISGHFPDILNQMNLGNDYKKTYFAVGRHRVVIELPTVRLETISVTQR